MGNFQQITQAGVFTNATKNILNSNFSQIQTVDLWVRPQYGNNAAATGTYDYPFATVAGALSYRLCVPGTIVGILGDVFEGDVTGPIINDITIVGMANQPRQATTSGVPNGGGSTWLAPAGGCTNLLTVQGQAWRLVNLFMNNSANSASTTANVKVLTTGDPPASADGAHIVIANCVMTGANAGAGTAYGVYTSGGTNFVTVDGCTFFNFTGSGETAIAQTTGAGVGTLLGWKVLNSYFYNNVHSIVTPSTVGFYIGNTFVSAGASVTATTLLSLTGGANNVIYNNKFGLDSNAAGIGTIVAMGTTPSAGPNFYNEQTEYGQPS